MDSPGTCVTAPDLSRRDTLIERLLALNLRQIFRPTSSTSTWGGKDCFAQTVQYYYGRPYDPQQALRDMLTGQLFATADITAAHIYSKQWDHIQVELGAALHYSTLLCFTMNSGK